MGFFSKLIFKHTCPYCGKHNIEDFGGHKWDANEENSHLYGDYAICKCLSCNNFFLDGDSMPHCCFCGRYMQGIYVSEFGHFGVYCKNCDHLPGYDEWIVGGQEAWQYEYYNYGRYRKSPIIDQLKNKDIAPFSNFYILSNIYYANGHCQIKRTARIIKLK